ncbi:MAG: ATP-binding protein [Bacteroidota bacterium]|jgi:two-component system phosphate regulon sensor histidine kinase PhoR
MKKEKHVKAPRMGKGRKIAIIFVLVALLPALFYSAYEISSLSSTEELIQSIYSKQLDVILFSINQYALDVAQSWSGEINTLLITSQPSRVDSDTRIFLNKRSAIHGVFYSDSTGHSISIVTRQTKEKARSDEDISVSSLQNQSATIEKILRYASSGYRKIEPVIIGDSVSGQGLLLMFVTSSRFPEQRIAGFLIDAKSFLTEVLQAKIEQAAGEEFLLAVFDRRNQHIVLSTSPVEITELREVKDIWLFPGHSIGIRLRGTSVEDVIRARSERNLILIGVLDILLIGAVWLVYRTLKKEMELVRLKGDFVSNVSHELRTPLSLIRMFTETLSMKRVPTEEKKQEYYETILQETERLTRLINNILNFSRMEAGKKQYYFEPIVLNDVVTGVMKTYTSHLQYEGFTTSVKLAENLPAIHADREAIAEALINILDNAVKYSTAEKYVQINTSQTDSMIYVEVEDHGIGIAKHHHKKIFETFYRVSTGLTNNIKGSGLGLSLVSHIMNAHGGMIELESVPGKGSTFRLLFPIVNRSDSTRKG